MFVFNRVLFSRTMEKLLHNSIFFINKVIFIPFYVIKKCVDYSLYLLRIKSLRKDHGH